MPIFLTWLLNGLGVLYSFFRKTKLANYAIFAVAMTTVLAAFALVKGAIVGIVATFVAAAPAIFPTVCSWFVPGNLDDCISARIAAELAFAVYRWQYNITLAAATARAS